MTSFVAPTASVICEFVLNLSPVVGEDDERDLLGVHEHASHYIQDVLDRGQREAQTLGPGKHVLADRFFARD